MDKIKLKRFDIAIIVFLIITSLASVVVTFASSYKKYDEKVVEISVKGKLYKRVPLDGYKENIRIKTDLGENTVEISDGRVRIIEASCPDHICEKDGFISKPGEVLVCLPNKVVVEIKGQNKSKIDDVAS